MSASEVDTYEGHLRYLEALEGQGALTLRIVYPYLVDCCRILALDDPLQQALEVALRFAEGRVRRAELEAQRLRVGRRISGRMRELRDPEVARSRAVLCVLHPEFGPEGSYGTIVLCHDFVLLAGGSEAALIETGERHGLNARACGLS